MKDIPIPNWVPLSMTAAYALTAVFVRTPEGVIGHVALAGGMFLVSFLLFIKCYVGGGVAKFFVAASLWIGPNAVFLAFLAVTMIGGLVLVLATRAARGKVEAVPCAIVLVPAFIIHVLQAPIWLAVVGSLHGYA